MATLPFLTLLKNLASPPTQTLHTHKPTSSTVTYTITTRSDAKSFGAKILFYLIIVLRFVLGAVCVVLLWTKWRVSTGKTVWPLGLIPGTGIEDEVVGVVDGIDAVYLVPIVLGVLYMVLKRSYKEESITFLSSLGLQTSTTSSIYLRAPTTRFIPTTDVQDIFIHEAFKGFEVKYYLAVVGKGETDVVIVFPRLMPRRSVLEVVWRGGRTCLFGEGKVTS